MSCDIQRNQIIELAKKVDSADIAYETFYELKFGSTDWSAVYHLGTNQQGGAFWAITRKSLFENSLLYVFEIYKRLDWFIQDESLLLKQNEDTYYPQIKSIQQCKADFMLYKP